MAGAMGHLSLRSFPQTVRIEWKQRMIYVGNKLEQNLAYHVYMIAWIYLMWALVMDVIL